MRKILYFISVALVGLLLEQGGPSGCGGGGTTPAEQVTLTILFSGPGDGTVTSDVGGIDCNQDETCSAEIDVGTVVTLTADPSNVSSLVGWSGEGCTGTSTCVVTLTADATVTVDFVRKIIFESVQSVDGSDALNDNGVTNIWLVNSDGTGLSALTEYRAADTFAFNPQWSPDGSKVVYSSQGAFDGSGSANAGTASNIWTVGSDGNSAVALTQLLNASSFDPQWSPDGTKIVFYSGRALNGTDAANDNDTFNVWVMDADGSNPTPLTALTAASANAVEPQWSPDGTKIVYRSRQALDGSNAANANNVPNIWMMNADGSGETPLTELDGTGVLQVDPDWSPDGTKIAFRANRTLDGSDAPNDNNTFNIWVMNADGTQETPLTSLTAASTFTGRPQWSPDGAEILFHSARALDGSDSANATSNIWVMNADGTGQEPLTELQVSTFGGSEPQWSPDGTKIVFKSGHAFDGSDASNTNSTINIWVMNADGSEPTPLTNITAQDAHTALPQWAP